MNRLFVLLLGLLLPLGLTGCPTSSGDDDDSGGITDDDDDDAADDDDATDDDMCDDDDATPQEDCTLPACAPTADLGVVSGTITDDAGDGLRCISLTVCSDVTCLFGKTDDNGDWCVDGLPADDYVVHNIDHPGENPQVNMRNWSSFYDFVVAVPDADTVLANAQVVPFMPESARVAGPWSGETELAWGGITVGFDGDQLEVPFPAASCPDDITLSAVEVPSAQFPVNGLMGWEVIGAWAFAPFETMQEDGNGDVVPFDITATVGAQDNTLEYGLLFADYEHNISTATFSEGTGALVGETIEGTVDRLSLVLAVRR
jgi:hypothetical protein